MMQVQVKQFETEDYSRVYQAMQSFTLERHDDTEDQIWCLQHHPVYTLGLNGDISHILQESDIPVIKTDRGGQVTYHGPGQLILYFMLDLQRLSCGVRTFVNRMEESVIRTLLKYKIFAERRPGAPGVYVDGKKIAALGVRVKKGCTYHGLALNVDMDLTPFLNIHPCGYRNMEVTQMSNYCAPPKLKKLAIQMLEEFMTLDNIRYTKLHSSCSETLPNVQVA